MGAGQVHPPSFGAEDRQSEIRSQYSIDADPYTRRPRHGFYVYRNRRIIVLAERFHGVVPSGTAAWAFRGRLMFDEEADDILSLDVKKRHCQLPKDARSNLQAIITMHTRKSMNAWRAAGRRVVQSREATKEQMANEGIRATPVADLGYAPGTDLSTQAAVDARKKLQEEIGAETLAQITDGALTEEVLIEKARESAVILVEGLRGNAMWLPYPAVMLGAAETLVNRTHSWVAEAYLLAEDDARITTLLHQVFTILARAELEVRSAAWRDVPPDTVGMVLERFRRKASAIAEDLADALASELEKLTEGPGQEFAEE